MPNPFQKLLLLALQPRQDAPADVRRRHIYAGTVEAAEKQRRRAKNRVARASRKINRKRAR